MRVTISLLQCSTLLMLAMTKDEAEDQEMIANTSSSMQFVYSCRLRSILGLFSSFSAIYIYMPDGLDGMDGIGSEASLTSEKL